MAQQNVMISRTTQQIVMFFLMVQQNVMISLPAQQIVIFSLTAQAIVIISLFSPTKCWYIPKMQWFHKTKGGGGTVAQFGPTCGQIS